MFVSFRRASPLIRSFSSELVPCLFHFVAQALLFLLYRANYIGLLIISPNYKPYSYISPLIRSFSSELVGVEQRGLRPGRR